MLVANQLVEIKWHGKNRKRYEQLGYHFTKIGDTFWVNAEDLNHSNNTISVKVECDYCGKIFETKFDSYLKGIKTINKSCCNNQECKSRKSSDVQLLQNRERQYSKFVELCEERGYTPISTIDDYKNCDTKLKYMCSKHGIKETTLSNFKNNTIGCVECGWDKNANKKRLSIDKAKEYIESLNNNIWLNPDEYINEHEKNLKIQCGSCGKIYVTRMSMYKYINTGKCPVCGQKRSRAEYKIATFLEKNNVNFIQEKYFKDCKDKQALLFDFYLPDYNLCVEFDGQQHFEPKFGIDNFVITKLHDAMKNQYCKWNNIDLLRIPYWEGNYIEQIISKKIHLNTMVYNS